MSLPEHRRLIYGRTFARTWHPADFDPLPHGWEQSDRHRYRIASVLLACFIGIALGSVLALWLST